MTLKFHCNDTCRWTALRTSSIIRGKGIDRKNTRECPKCSLFQKEKELESPLGHNCKNVTPQRTILHAWFYGQHWTNTQSVWSAQVTCTQQISALLRFGSDALQGKESASTWGHPIVACTFQDHCWTPFPQCYFSQLQSPQLPSTQDKPIQV